MLPLRFAFCDDLFVFVSSSLSVFVSLVAIVDVDVVAVVAVVAVVSVDTVVPVLRPLQQLHESDSHESDEDKLDFDELAEPRPKLDDIKGGAGYSKHTTQQQNQKKQITRQNNIKTTSCITQEWSHKSKTERKQ